MGCRITSEPFPASRPGEERVGRLGLRKSGCRRQKGALIATPHGCGLDQCYGPRKDISHGAPSPGRGHRVSIRRIERGDLKITWKYSGYCRATRAAAFDFSIDSGGGTAFADLECVAYDLAHVADMIQAIRPLLVGPEGVIKEYFGAAASAISGRPTLWRASEVHPAPMPNRGNRLLHVKALFCPGSRSRCRIGPLEAGLRLLPSASAGSPEEPSALASGTGFLRIHRCGRRHSRPIGLACIFADAILFSVTRRHLGFAKASFPLAFNSRAPHRMSDSQRRRKTNSLKAVQRVFQAKMGFVSY